MGLNWPNRISLLRLVLIVPLVYFLLQLGGENASARRAALTLLLIVSLSDALDGYLARRLNQITPLGRWLDPLADKLVGAVTLVFLAFERTGVPGYVIPAWVPIIALAKDAWTVAGAALLKGRTRSVVVHPRVFGKACTAVQFVLVGYCLAAPDAPLDDGLKKSGQSALCWLAAALAAAAATDYTLVGARTLRDFRRPARPGSRSGTHAPQ